MAALNEIIDGIWKRALGNTFKYYVFVVDGTYTSRWLGYPAQSLPQCLENLYFQSVCTPKVKNKINQIIHNHVAFYCE